MGIKVKDDKKLLTAAKLRCRAEERLPATKSHPPSNKKTMQRLVHELEVHQIELEMQNAELLQARDELEISRNTYTELYDFAPVGYFTFDASGLIREINLAGALLLGRERGLLTNKPLSSFIADADGREIFSSHLGSVLQRQGMQQCEIRLTRKDGTVIYGRLQSIAMEAVENKDEYILTSIADDTARKQAEEALQKAHDNLEVIVQERTRELLKVNELLSLEIAERKQAEEALRESDVRYRSLFDGACEGIAVAEMETMRFLHVNPAFCRLLGYSQEEITAMGVESIHPAENLEYVLGEFHAQACGKKELAVDIPCLRKDGTILYADIAATAIHIDEKICNVGYFNDVSERKRLYDALRNSEERFKQVAESAGEWIWEVDTNGLYTYSSPAVEKILGYKPEEIVGRKHFYDHFVPEEREEYKKAALRAFADKETFRGFINANLHKNGKRIILETSGVPNLDDQGGLIGYRGADTDITERKQAEVAARKSKEEFRAIAD